MSKFYRFAYLDRRKNEPNPHMLRDCDGCLEFCDYLYGAGYSYGGLFVNFPNHPVAVDLDRFGEHDLIVVTTRPPMDDERQGGHRDMSGTRSGNSLEERIFSAFSQNLFNTCSRARVVLIRSLTSQLAPGFEHRGDVQFRMHGRRASYTGQTQLTAAYLLRLKEAWPGGPGLLAAFSLGGAETLAWCYILRTRHPELLESPGVVCAELRMEPDVPAAPLDLGFADSWGVTLIVQKPL